MFKEMEECMKIRAENSGHEIIDYIENPMPYYANIFIKNFVAIFDEEITIDKQATKEYKILFEPEHVLYVKDFVTVQHKETGKMKDVKYIPLFCFCHGINYAYSFIDINDIFDIFYKRLGFEDLLIEKELEDTILKFIKTNICKIDYHEFLFLPWFYSSASAYNLVHATTPDGLKEIFFLVDLEFPKQNLNKMISEYFVEFCEMTFTLKTIIDERGGVTENKTAIDLLDEFVKEEEDKEKNDKEKY